MNKTKKIFQNSIIDRIESELLSTLLNYVIPFLDKKINVKVKQREEGRKISNLEGIVSNPKIGLRDIKELESLLLKNQNESVKVNKNVRFSSTDIQYSINLIKQKNNKKSADDSILIKYEENGQEEKVSISIKKDEEVYSAEIVNKKDKLDNVIPYTVTVSYENRYSEERLLITYRQQLKNYLKQHAESKEDMSNRVPLKWVNILPESQMGGVLGFTYLGDNSMGRRADLTGKTARMVNIHESIHTPDEYETRILTSWIMEKVREKYVK